MAHSKTTFQPKWLEHFDGNGQCYKLWCKASNESLYEARCIDCQNAVINVANNGLASLKQHSLGKKHQRAAKSL